MFSFALSDTLQPLQKRESDMGIIEVDMFSKDVDDPKHPVAESFRDLLNEVAEQYSCSLESFDVKRGVVSFSFDSDELMADIIKILHPAE